MSDREVLYSFDIWDTAQACPHCGSEDIEYDLGYDRAVCCWCGRHSAEPFDNEFETAAINDLWRLQYEG